MTTDMRLDNRVALVTGASSGLGRHFAVTLARAGAKVACAARRTDRLQDVVDEIADFDGRAIAVKLDVTDVESIHHAVNCAATELGPITVLVNNSGVAQTKAALELTEQDWDSVIDVNLRGAWLMAQETARHMVDHGHGGTIINVASILAIRVTKQLASYSASKAGLVQLTRALALELADHGIRVNAIAPGYIETDINRDFFASEPGQAMIRRIPQKRIGHASELDGPLMLLASDAGSFMTGAVLVVDGGHSVNSI